MGWISCDVLGSHAPFVHLRNAIGKRGSLLHCCLQAVIHFYLTHTTWNSEIQQHPDYERTVTNESKEKLAEGKPHGQQCADICISSTYQGKCQKTVWHRILYVQFHTSGS